MRAIFEIELGSINGDEAFFSVARTTPLVATLRLVYLLDNSTPALGDIFLTFDANGRDALVDSIQRIF